MNRTSCTIVFACLLFICTAGKGLSAEYYPTVFSAKRKINDRTLIHDHQFGRVIEFRRSTLLAGGNSQIKISKSAENIQGRILTLPFAIKDIKSYRIDQLLVTVNGQSPKVMLMDTTGKILAIDEQSFPVGIDTAHIVGIHGNMAFVLFGDRLFSIKLNAQNLSPSLLADQVSAFEYVPDGIHCIKRSGGGYVLRSFNKTGTITRDIPFSPMGTRYRILSVSRSIGVLSTTTGESTNGFIFQNATGRQEMMFFPCGMNSIAMWEEDQKPVLSWVKEQENGTRQVIIQHHGNQTQTISLPDFFTNVLSSSASDGTLRYFFGNGICFINRKAQAIESASHIGMMSAFQGNAPIFIQLNNENIINFQDGYILLAKVDDPFWWLRRFATTSGRILIGGLIVFFLSLFYRHYSRQKRFLEAGLELSGMGMIMYLDDEGRLSKLNSTAKSVLQLSSDVPLHRPIRYYVNKPHVSELLEFIEQAMIHRKPMQTRLSIGSEESIKEYIWSATPLFGFAGSFSGCILSGLDITAELEKKRLTNWAQLAHDMQTNLSIILLNAQQMQIIDEKNVQRQKKILGQITLLMQRVRDIVTVGRDEDAHLSLNDGLVLCRNVINEFDEQLYPNAVLSFSGKQVMFMCDSIKLTRGLRNAVENGVRALQKKEGTVDLSCTFDDNNVYFRIKDSGVGMDAYTRENMMKPYFTTKRSQGGYGIGTMVMQKVAEMHGGRIEVVSEPGKGSVITFIIPKLMPETKDRQ